jgi:hypothetical protein
MSSKEIKTRQAVGLLIFDNIDKYEKIPVERTFGEINIKRPPCGLMRRLISNHTLSLISGQGINGVAIKACLGKKCKRNKNPAVFAMKLISFGDDSEHINDMTLPQNYEVYVLNLLQKLISTNQTPHLVYFYTSYICQCSEYFPFALTLDVLNIHQQLDFPDKINIDLFRKASRVIAYKSSHSKAFKYYFPRGRTLKKNAYLLFASLQSLQSVTSVIFSRVCVIWTAFLSNYFRELVFPPIDFEFKAAKFQTLIIYIMMFCRDITGQTSQYLAYQAYYKRSLTVDFLETLGLSSTWIEVSDEISKGVDLILKQTKSSTLSQLIKTLSNISSLIPIAHANISPSVKVPHRIFNFSVRTILTEWVHGAPMSDFFDANWFMLTELDFKIIYFQFLSTLYTIQKEYPGFVHNDCHLGNILVRFNTIQNTWPFNSTVNRKNETFKIQTVKQNLQYFTLMQSDSYSVEFQSFTPPFNIKKTQRYNQYSLLSKTCFVPDRGLSLRLWDFDLSTIKQAGYIENSKSKNLKNGQFYDIHMFFVQMIKTLEITSSNSFFSNNQNDLSLMFPETIHKFHKKWIFQKNINYSGMLTQKMQRLSGTSNTFKFPTAKQILTAELQQGGLFHSFLNKPTLMRKKYTYKT